MTNAVKQLMVGPWTCPQSGTSGGVMQCMSALNNTTYKAAIYTFDYALNTIQTLTTPTTAGTKIGNIQLLTVDHQNCPVLNGSGGCIYTTDYGTDISKGLTDLNTIMPNPGDGSATGTPQEVVFLVTDGVEDKLIPKSGAAVTPTLPIRFRQPTPRLRDASNRLIRRYATRSRIETFVSRSSTPSTWNCRATAGTPAVSRSSTIRPHRRARSRNGCNPVRHRACTQMSRMVATSTRL